MSMGVKCHPLLCHYLMCKEVTTFDPANLEELLFPVGDYLVCFNRKSLCLVTDLRFGDYFHPSSGFPAFRERVFPFMSLSRSVTMDDLTNVFNNSLRQLSNEDVVRVSLVYMLKQGFLGKYPQQPVTNEHMTLISNLQKFNRHNSFYPHYIKMRHILIKYPWGRLIWDFTYKKPRTVFVRIEDHLNPNTARIDSRHTYTL
uniref:Uncharacterized protein n=1 Tax=Lactuca sativa TaxID=4236 RepID=A0A9R1WT15_LACSA|nr:hypothetical protein LSAT_V11C900479840 [Lactuca sativa]